MVGRGKEKKPGKKISLADFSLSPSPSPLPFPISVSGSGEYFTRISKRREIVIKQHSRIPFIRKFVNS